MNQHRTEPPSPGVAALGVAVVAVACCAAGPLIVAVVSSVALGLVLGIGAGVASLVGLTALVIAVRRHRATARHARRRG
jgi:hypothetical protein